MITMSPDHVYTLTLPGQAPRILPSNTQILKDRGIIDTRYYNEKAAQRGTDVHRLIAFWLEQRALGNDVEWSEVDESIRGYCMAGVKFCLDTGFRAVLVEKMLWHSSGYATTIDGFGFIGCEAALLEWKTGAIPKWVWLQMALQDEARIERAKDGYIDVGHGSVRKIAVCLKKDGKYSVQEKFEPKHTGDAIAHVRSYLSAKEYQ